MHCMNSLSPPTGPELRSHLPRDVMKDHLKPSFKKLFHLHPPRNPFQVTNTSQPTILYRPFDRL